VEGDTGGMWWDFLCGDVREHSQQRQGGQRQQFLCSIYVIKILLLLKIIVIIIIIIIIKSLEKSKHTVQVKLELPPHEGFFGDSLLKNISRHPGGFSRWFASWVRLGWLGPKP